MTLSRPMLRFPNAAVPAIWLVLAAVFVGQALSAFAAAESECKVRGSNTLGHTETGRIVGILTREQGLVSIQRTQRNMRGLIDPAYIPNVRVLVSLDKRSQFMGAVVPQDRHVNIGDHVTFVTAHRNKALPCNYIPNLITNPIIGGILPKRVATVG